jgi:hypothetical protein
MKKYELSQNPVMDNIFVTKVSEMISNAVAQVEAPSRTNKVDTEHASFDPFKCEFIPQKTLHKSKQ